jgi:hypothetical protein
MKVCEDFTPNFGDKNMTVASQQHTISHVLFQQGITDQNNNMIVVPHPPYFSLFPRLKVKLKASILTQLR